MAQWLSICLPRRFDSRTRRHVWVECVVGSRPCSERFFSGYSGFPLSSKPNISKFQLDLESWDHKFISPGLLHIYLFSITSNLFQVISLLSEGCLSLKIL